MELTEEKKKKLLIEYSVFEENDEGTKKLVLPNLAELIFNAFDYNFLTTRDNAEMYYHNGGYYEPNGEQLIKQLTEEFLEEGTKEHNKREVVGYIRDKNYQNRSIFSPPINLISLENGVYDIDKDALIKNTPDQYFLTQLPIKYDEKAQCPKIKKFLNEVVYKADIPVIQEFFGYCPKCV